MASVEFLKEFPPVSREAWEAAIGEDLKGAGPAKLTWHAEDGLDLKPFYRAEDVAALNLRDASPGEFPWMRGTRAAGGWRIREEVDAPDAEDANRQAREAVAAGAEEIAFRAVRIESASDLAVALGGLDEIPVHFDGADERGMR